MPNPFFDKTYDDIRRILTSLCYRMATRKGIKKVWVDDKVDDLVQTGFEGYLKAYNSKTIDKENPKAKSYCMLGAINRIEEILQSNLAQGEPNYQRQSVKKAKACSELTNKAIRLDEVLPNGDRVGWLKGKCEPAYSLAEFDKSALNGLTEQEKLLLAYRVIMGESDRAIAKRIGKSDTHVNQLFNGTQWRVGILEKIRVNTGAGRFRTRNRGKNSRKRKATAKPGKRVA